MGLWTPKAVNETRMVANAITRAKADDAESVVAPRPAIVFTPAPCGTRGLPSATPLLATHRLPKFASERETSPRLMCARNI